MTAVLLHGLDGAYVNLIEAPFLGGVILHTIYVPPRSRGRGIGHDLLVRSIAYAETRGMPIMLAPVPDADVAFDIRAWYRRHGFVPTPSGMMLERPLQGAPHD